MVWSKEKTRIIRTGKERIRNMVKRLFDNAVLRFTESDVELPPWDWAVIMGYDWSADMETWVSGCAAGTKES